jgi:hypothetical protein
VLAACLIAVALTVTAGTAEAKEPAASRPANARAAVVFLQSPRKAINRKPFLQGIAAVKGITALGYVSAIQGRYSPEQVLLDISSGARVQTGLYDFDLPEGIALTPSGPGWAISHWARILARSRTPPADIDPGSLAQPIIDSGARVGFVGVAGSSNREAIVAADRSGRLKQVSLGGAGSVGRRSAALWRRSRLLVARLPAGSSGRSALDTILGARRPQDLVIVLQDPNAVFRRVLAAGTAGLEGGSDLRSDSTRTDGLVVSTDIAPTILDRLGIEVPPHVSGEPIEARGSRSAEDLVSFRKRLSVVGPRRWSVVFGGLGGAIALLALVSIGRWRRLGRCALLAALWLPSVLLVTGSFLPTALVELGILALASAALAYLTDRLVPWPRSTALASGVTVGVHVLDLALGSKLIVRSLLGPNPLLGARFFGIGNELEITLAVTTLLGLGGALVGASPRARVWGFALGGGLVVFLFSWGRLGADVGAAITLGVGVATAAVVAAGKGSRRTRAAIVLGAPALAVGALAALDLATGGNAHFTRSVLRAGGLDELAQVAQRRFELSYSSLGRGIIGPLVILAAALFLTGLRFRDRLLANISGIPAFRAGLWGAVAAVVGGTLTNDSGPVIFLIGITYLALAVGYVAGMPKKSAAGTTGGAPLPGAQKPR